MAPNILLSLSELPRSCGSILKTSYSILPYKNNNSKKHKTGEKLFPRQLPPAVTSILANAVAHNVVPWQKKMTYGKRNRLTAKRKSVMAKKRELELSF